MSPNRQKNLQTAQGMVEFALVLPILLLVVLGIFAFGHLFFTYSSVVSASREAARWGSAVGVADSLRPRYRDCDAIRASAVRVGSFAGVAATDGPDDGTTPGIYIGFDRGPNDVESGIPDFNDCSDNDGPNDIAYGDRIKVRVTVQYTPIVPFVNIPSFPLTATTARTIIRSLPVGEAPTAAPAYPSTQIIMEFLPIPVPAELPAWPVVGQAVNVRIRVTSSDNTSPTGRVDIVDELGHSCSVSASSAEPGQLCEPPLIPEGEFTEVGTHYVTARYDPGGACYQPSELIDEPLDVIKADTTVTISGHPNPSNYPGQDVVLTVTVAADNPGAGVPTGFVTISDLSGNTWTTPITGQTGTITVNPMVTTSYIAVYEGDTNFNPSPPSTPWVQTVTQPATETPTLTPTPFGQVTLTPTPTRTAMPETCPSLVGPVDFSVANSLQFGISNTNGSNADVSSIDLTWPENPITRLREVRFGDLAGLDTCTPRGGGRNCLWQSPDPLNGPLPPSVTLNRNVNNWDNPSAVLTGNTTKYMRFFFNAALSPGDYFMAIHFSNGCVLEVPATR